MGNSRHIFAPVGLLLAFSLMMGGCAANTNTTDSSAESSAGAEQQAAADTGSTAQASLDIDMAAMDFEYTDRDKDASYDAASATYITLDGASASVAGAGEGSSAAGTEVAGTESAGAEVAGSAADVSVEGSVVTITAAGTYVVSGTLSDGQLVVDATSEDKVQLVFDDVSIHNEDGPAVYVKQADKVFVTLAEGSENVLTDGAEYVLEDESDEPYATLFSKDDLTINGTGSLRVEAAYKHAICSKDDLVVTGGTYVVNAAEDALRGRDCVKILDGMNGAGGMGGVQEPSGAGGAGGMGDRGGEQGPDRR